MIKIAKAEERHIPDICNLWLEFSQFSQAIDPVYELHDGMIPVFEEEYLRPAMNSKNSLVLIALDIERVVGYSFSQINESSNLLKRQKFGYIQDLFITKNYRRRGIGKKMYDENLKWFHAKDIDRVELQVIAKNKAAHAFWKKQGFRFFQNTLYRQP
jgi:ribosomal protein S18 acetylase RimI-like enzyme